MESFFFLRSGRTDWAAQGPNKQDNMGLNEDGRNQIQEAAKILAGHPFASLCYSPLKRTTESAKIVAKECLCSLHAINDLVAQGENNAERKLINEENDVFKKRVLEGFKHAFTFPEPTLFISHECVLEVICQELGIDPKIISNSLLIHFYQNLGKWTLDTLMEYA